MAEERRNGERGSDKGGILLAVAVGLGVLVVSATTGDLPFIDQTMFGQAFDLMNGQTGTP